MDAPTDKQGDTLRHMLGINDPFGGVTPSRNYWCGDAGDATLTGLQAAGWVEYMGEDERGAFWRVTSEGIAIAQDSARKRRPSRAARRYAAFLSVKDVAADLTFRTFLCDARWKDVRDGHE